MRYSLSLAILGLWLCTATPSLDHDINLFAVTDVHSWLAGGDQEPPVGAKSPFVQDAGFGDLVSFITHAKAKAKSHGKDVFLFDNGDVVGGTGLSNVADDHCRHVLPILQNIPFDALNCGNHELYNNRTMEHFHASGYIKSWNGRYLTSNLQNATNGEYLGSRYTVLRGENSGVTLLVFGFMYNMTTEEGKCDAVSVVSVQETVKSAWFYDALNEEGKAADAIVLLAHMDADEPLIHLIVDSIRKVLPVIPVQVFAGHSHARKNHTYDYRANVFEPGNFFNTLGHSAFSLPSPDDSDSPVDFKITNINTNVEEMSHLVNLPASNFTTSNGLAVSDQIETSRQELGLTKLYGCVDQYLAGAQLFDKYLTEIIPFAVFEPPTNTSQWLLQSSGALRYELFPGNFTADDVYKVLPFGDQFFVVRRLKGSILTQLLHELNKAPPPAFLQLTRQTFDPRGPRPFNHPPNKLFPPTPKPLPFGSSNNHPGASTLYDAIFVSFDLALVKKVLAKIIGHPVQATLFRPEMTDTLAMMYWASKTLKPC